MGGPHGRGRSHVAFRITMTLGFLTAGHLHKLWVGRPRPRPAPWPALGAREVVVLQLAGGARGTRADQGVCPTSFPRNPKAEKIKWLCSFSAAFAGLNPEHS